MNLGQEFVPDPLHPFKGLNKQKETHKPEKSNKGDAVKVLSSLVKVTA